MSRVSVGLVKVRRRLFEEEIDRGLLVAGLVGLGTVAMMHFVANNIIVICEALGATLKRVF